MSQICIRPDCPCAASKEVFTDSAIVFCTYCGGRLQPLIGSETITVPDTRPIQPHGPISALAPTGHRIVAFLLDAIISFILGFVALVPVIGQFVGGLLLTIFWLFRDVNGGSPGKMALGLAVANRSNRPATARQRILRNFPFAISIAPLIIPFVGYEIAAVLEGIAIVIEVIMVLFTGDRLTDRLVGTKVIRRSDLAD